jgi:hypothetical protein
MNAIELIQLLIDFGLVILILMVQIIIYPSFLYYHSSDLHKWHPIYTGKITVIVAPLMITQLVLAAYVLVINRAYSITEITSLTLITINWLLTMLVFIPLHQKIDQDASNQQTQLRLLNYNWIRVALFCLVFIVHSVAFYAQVDN